MRTLYEVLEVSENASKEIIEKAYRVLAKKYHPDLQTEGNKAEAERRMKEINEAYSILSDDSKRGEYDNKLAIERQEEQERQNANRQAQEQTSGTQGQTYYEAQRNYGTQRQTYNNEQRPMTKEKYREAQRRQREAIKQQQEMQAKVQAEYEQKYQEAYEDYLRSLGYKIKHKWTWKRFKELLITILIIIAICLILWFLPPTHKWIVEFYNSNPIVKTIVDVIGGIFKGIWNGICSLFKRN